MIQVKPHIAAMATYAPPWGALDRSQYLRLDLNENTQPPPPSVTQALTALIQSESLQMYPDYNPFLPCLANYVGVREEELIISNGSDHSIELLLKAFLAPGDTMVIAQPEFPIFTQVARGMNANIRAVPFTPEMHFPITAFRAALKEKTELIVLISPNNPTGSLLPDEELRYILKTYPTTPIIVDEAYFEFTGKTALSLLKQHDNLIICRTFSKAFAMAGLRLGYTIAPPAIIKQLYKIRGPFDINSCALAAATAQILNPAPWQAYIKEVMTHSKPMLEEFFNQQKIPFFPGAANFMLVRPGNRDQVVAQLKEKKILVRPMVAPGITDTFRLSIGTVEDTQRFMRAFAT